MVPDAPAVLAANEAFYAAFRERDLQALDALWAREHPTAVIHPGWPAVLGRDAVMESWRRIIEGPAPPAIRCAGAEATLMGDTAFVICLEQLPDGVCVATNVFVREDGEWRLVHHHAGPVPPGTEVPEPPTTVH